MLRRQKQSKKSTKVIDGVGVLGDETKNSQRPDEIVTSLESTVFGGEDEIVDKLDEYSNSALIKHKRKRNEMCQPQPAWTDDDPSIHSDTKLVKATAKWAQLPSQRSESEDSESESEDENVSSSTGNYLVSASRLTSLPGSQLNFRKCRDANADRPAKGKVKSVEFHRTAQIMLTAGMDQTLRLFQIDGRNNPCIQSVFFDTFPIHRAHFSYDGHEVIVGSRHSAFYCYDMIAGQIINIPRIKGLDGCSMKNFEISPDGTLLAFAGRYGSIHLLTAKSKELVCTLKMNGDVEALVFSNDGDKLLSHGLGGEVYVWDVRCRACCHKFVDDGCGIRGTSLAMSTGSQYLATGSESGMVNIYDLSTCLRDPRPQPIKTVPNLTSSCSSLKFNSTDEILAMASNMQEKALRLVHMRSRSVFANFPDRTDDMRIPFAVDMSLHSGYLAVGTHAGRALLYRLKHYSDY